MYDRIRFAKDLQEATFVVMLLEDNRYEAEVMTAKNGRHYIVTEAPMTVVENYITAAEEVREDCEAEIDD